MQQTSPHRQLGWPQPGILPGGRQPNDLGQCWRLAGPWHEVEQRWEAARADRPRSRRTRIGCHPRSRRDARGRLRSRWWRRPSPGQPYLPVLLTSVRPARQALLLVLPCPALKAGPARMPVPLSLPRNREIPADPRLRALLGHARVTQWRHPGNRQR